MKKYIIVGLIAFLIPIVLFAQSKQKKADLDIISKQLDMLILEARLAREDRQQASRVEESRMFGGVTPNVPTFSSAASSSAVSIGPDNSVQIIGTSSKRTYLYISLMGQNTLTAATSSKDAFCTADNDKVSALYRGIRLSATSTYSYEFTSDRGNLYTGAVRCTSEATTTLGITEYRTP